VTQLLFGHKQGKEENGNCKKLLFTAVTVTIHNLCNTTGCLDKNYGNRKPDKKSIQNHNGNKIFL
jgi:hypothetical protein